MQRILCASAEPSGKYLGREPTPRSAETMIRPPFCRSRLLVDANGGAVDHLGLGVVRSRDTLHQPAPHACPSPSYEEVVAGGARAITLGQIAPRRIRSQHQEDAVQHAPIISTRHACTLIGSSRLIARHSKPVRSYRLMVSPKSESGTI
jgi:hypothetical protein